MAKFVVCVFLSFLFILSHSVFLTLLKKKRRKTTVTRESSKLSSGFVRSEKQDMRKGENFRLLRFFGLFFFFRSFFPSGFFFFFALILSLRRRRRPLLVSMMMSLAAWSSSLVLPEFDSYGSTSSDVRARLVTATSRNLSFFLDLVQKVVDNCSKMAGWCVRRRIRGCFFAAIVFWPLQRGNKL